MSESLLFSAWDDEELYLSACFYLLKSDFTSPCILPLLVSFLSFSILRICLEVTIWEYTLMG